MSDLLHVLDYAGTHGAWRNVLNTWGGRMTGGTYEVRPLAVHKAKEPVSRGGNRAGEIEKRFFYGRSRKSEWGRHDQTVSFRPFAIIPNTAFSMARFASEPRGKGQGIRHARLAITDHGGMFGAVEFYNTAQGRHQAHHRFRSLCGPQSAPRQDQNGRGELSSSDLLARNNEGYKNLMQLSSIGYLEDSITSRASTWKCQEILGGKSCHQLCVGGRITRAAASRRLKKAQTITEAYIDIFG